MRRYDHHLNVKISSNSVVKDEKEDDYKYLRDWPVSGLPEEGHLSAYLLEWRQNKSDSSDQTIQPAVGNTLAHVMQRASRPSHFII